MSDETNITYQLSMPFWHRRVPHQHKFDTIINVSDITTRDGKETKVGELYVKECTSCGEVRGFRVMVQ